MAAASSIARARNLTPIIIDPPPPLEAAASSLLYSRDFYLLAKQHMTTPAEFCSNGCYAGRRCGPGCGHSCANRGISLRARVSVDGGRIAIITSSRSMSPISRVHGGATRRPHAAACDPGHDGVGSGEDSGRAVWVCWSRTNFAAQQLIAPAANTPALQDDRPINEYYWLRTKYPGLMKNLQ